jgi:two-component system sensor histidine kinase YesM
MSHIVIIGFMLVPLFVSVVISLYNTISYDRLISNVDKTNRINQIVKTEITNELWDIVAGNKSFEKGMQYRIIGNITDQINDIMTTAARTESRQLLEVASRAMNTLVRYVNRLEVQMKEGYPVIENEKILDEIRGVSLLVSEILQDFIVLEIESIASANENIKQRAFVLAAIECVIIIFVTIFSLFVQISVAANIDTSIGAMASLSGRIAEGDLDARAEVPPVMELNSLTENLNNMAGKIKTLIEANVQEQKNLQKSEMRALQAQITPHFLYNTLDSIIWLAEGAQYDQVISITQALSTFFRISLNRGSEWVSVKDEFSHIASYLTIQKIRYRDILDYSIDYEARMENNTILKLLLQPLVENALYHGIKNKRSRGMIKVRGWQEGSVLCFSIEDNGIGMTGERLADVRKQLQSRPNSEAVNSVYGLYNVSKRLELYYNKAARLDIRSVYKEGTVVTIQVPEAAENV